MSKLRMLSLFDDHTTRAHRIFEAVGHCLPADESYFNAITALSASGTAYQYLIMEAFAEAGVPAETWRILVRHA